jgi:predicted RNA binding protein YcfA (HicA-like mRNA interferase family)
LPHDAAACADRQGVVRALEKAGFVVVRTSGSHRRLEHSSDPTGVATVPVHAGKTLKRGTLHGIIKQAGLTADEFVALL